MNNLNQVTLMGRLTADPELRYSRNNDIPYCNFTIAINDPLSKEAREAGKEPNVNFIDCVAWRKQAENIATQRKGNIVLVLGKIEKSSYIANDGSKRYSTKVSANRVMSVQFMSNSNQEQQEQEYVPKIDEDIPF